MNEHEKRRIAFVRVENIEPLHIQRAVLKINLASAHPARRSALFSPARKDLRMVANRGARVVFAFEKGGFDAMHGESSCASSLDNYLAPV